ncbi:MAG: hypothetical protein WBM90_02755 [Acidimicrobiia bacterium]
MAIETDGTVRMKGDIGPGVAVRILAGDGRLRLLSGNELVGDWQVRDLGINALHEGFNLRAEGEEFTLRASDDASLAEELGVIAASPRLARKVATLHNPEEPASAPAVEDVDSSSPVLFGIAFALGGVLILLGGWLLKAAPSSAAALHTLAVDNDRGGSEFWIAFVIGGMLMVGAAVAISTGAKWARLASLTVMVLTIVLFGWVMSEGTGDAGHVTAYGFIAGGIVVGVSVLFSGSFRGLE